MHVAPSNTYVTDECMQGRQVAEGEEMPIDPPALNDDTSSLCTAQEANFLGKTSTTEKKRPQQRS